MDFLLSLAIVCGLGFGIYKFAFKPVQNWLADRGYKLTILRAILICLGVWLSIWMLTGSGTGLPVMTSFSIVGVLAAAGWYFFARRQRGGADDVHQRGGQIVSEIKLKNLSLRVDKHPVLRLGDVGIPNQFEGRHILLSGSTGSGKSQALYQLISSARKRGDGGIVADVNGEMFSRFYNPERGDVLLNPLDARCAAHWSPLAEIAGIYDCDRLAKSLIPDAEGSGAEWNHYAQTLLSAVLSRVWSQNGTNYELTNLLLTATNEELAEELKGSSAAQLFAPGADRMLASIRAITSTFCKPLSYLNPIAGTDGFSITKFIQKEAKTQHGAFLFMPARDDFFKSIRSLVAAQLDVSISATLAGPDSESHKVLFVADEFSSWGKVASVIDLLAKGRKKGAICILGLQTVSQLQEAYGRHGAQTLLANLGNTLTLRAGDQETAEYMSRAIGDQQVRRTNESVNADDKTTTSEQIAQQRAIMPAEIQNLPDLKGVLTISGDLPAGWVTIPISTLQKRHEPFQMISKT